MKAFNLRNGLVFAAILLLSLLLLVQSKPTISDSDGKSNVRRRANGGNDDSLSDGGQGMIDVDTRVLTVPRHHDGKRLSLVFSDEFNDDGRGFGPGEDDVFEAIEKPDDTNQAIQFYNASKEYVTTRDGSLILTTKAVKTSWIMWGRNELRPLKGTKNYTSGMIQTWNKFCFTGGVLEMSIQLPGHSDSGGLWPAAWLMGNLARATYEKSVMYNWPWSYDRCETSPAATGPIKDLPFKQEINACQGSGEDAAGFGMHPHQGRGAPEIDIFEVMPGHEMPGVGHVQAFMSNSLQIAPGIPKSMHRPTNGERLTSNDTWYRDLVIGEGGVKGEAEFNWGFWGQMCGPEYDASKEQLHKYQEDAISVNTKLKETHFASHHLFRLEWQPGEEGYLEWYLDDELIFGIKGQSLTEHTGSLIPVEPMYLILNTAISHRWGMPEPCDKAHCSSCWVCYDCTNPECQCSLPLGMQNCKNLPAEMKIDFIRLYQDKSDKTHTLSCSPENFPTAEWIQGHPERYANWAPLETRIPLPPQLLPFYGAYGVAALFALLIAVGACVYLISAMCRHCAKASGKGSEGQGDGGGRVSVVANDATYLLASGHGSTHVELVGARKVLQQGR